MCLYVLICVCLEYAWHILRVCKCLFLVKLMWKVLVMLKRTLHWKHLGTTPPRVPQESQQEDPKAVAKLPRHCQSMNSNDALSVHGRPKYKSRTMTLRHRSWIHKDKTSITIDGAPERDIGPLTPHRLVFVGFMCKLQHARCMQGGEWEIHPTSLNYKRRLF